MQCARIAICLLWFISPCSADEPNPLEQRVRTLIEATKVTGPSQTAIKRDRIKSLIESAGRAKVITPKIVKAIDSGDAKTDPDTTQWKFTTPQAKSDKLTELEIRLAMLPEDAGPVTRAKRPEPDTLTSDSQLAEGSIVLVGTGPPTRLELAERIVDLKIHAYVSIFRKGQRDRDRVAILGMSPDMVDALELKRDVSFMAMVLDVERYESVGGSRVIPSLYVVDPDKFKRFVDKYMPNEPTEPKPKQIKRKWQSADGKFTLDATLRLASETDVKLIKDDGNEVTVPVSRLSESDAKWVECYRRAIGPFEGPRID